MSFLKIVKGCFWGTLYLSKITSDLLPDLEVYLNHFMIVICGHWIGFIFIYLKGPSGSEDLVNPNISA